MQLGWGLLHVVVTFYFLFVTWILKFKGCLMFIHVYAVSCV